MTILLHKNQTAIHESKGEKIYECYIWICPESNGGFSVTMPCLPGVCSQGETEEEVIQNIKEAFQGAATCYLENGGAIPWLSKGEIEVMPANTKEKWIVVHV
jgi:predicted RNase H-like HicB family nuclease